MFSFVANLAGSLSQPWIVLVISDIWSGVGAPVAAVKARPPACLASFNQSILLNVSLTTSPALDRAGRFSISPVTIDSIRAIFASSKPWNLQLLTLILSIFCSSWRESSIISKILDFPAPQSPWTPTVTGVLGWSLSSSIMVFAIASLLRRSILVSLSLSIIVFQLNLFLSGWKGDYSNTTPPTESRKGCRCALFAPQFTPVYEMQTICYQNSSRSLYRLRPLIFRADAA